MRLVGELDPRMAGAVVEAIISTPDLSVVLDLTELRSFDGSGVRAIDEASDRLACRRRLGR